MTDTIICGICQELLGDKMQDLVLHNKPHATFHGQSRFYDFAAFKNSAASGCEVCSLFFKNMKSWTNVHELGLLESRSMRLYVKLWRTNGLKCFIRLEHCGLESNNMEDDPMYILAQLNIQKVEGE